MVYIEIKKKRLHIAVNCYFSKGPISGHVDRGSRIGALPATRTDLHLQRGNFRSQGAHQVHRRVQTVQYQVRELSIFQFGVIIRTLHIC